MSPAFLLSAIHELKLEAKQCTPILTKGIPLHPGPKPTNQKMMAQWKKNANLFARYILTVFRPESEFYDPLTQTNQYEYDYQALQSWIKSLQDDNNMISKFRLITIQRAVSNLRSRFSVKKMLNEHRARNRDLWENPQMHGNKQL